MGDKGRRDREKKKRQKSAHKSKKAGAGRKPDGGTRDEDKKE